MLDEESELASRLFTADTGDASRDGWVRCGDQDRYRRFAKVAMNFQQQLQRGSMSAPKEFWTKGL